MCIAIYKPAQHSISLDTLEECYCGNPDGIGIAYAMRGKLHCQKWMDWEPFADWFIGFEDRISGVDAAIHFRIATHGRVDKRNCHPHLIRGDLAMIHNGILPIEVPANSRLSDTAIFAQKLNALGIFERRKNTLAEIEKKIGAHNKIVLINAQSHVAILNEYAGIWDKGVWYSNCSYRPARYERWNSAQDYDCDPVYEKPVTCWQCQSPCIADWEIRNGVCVECYREEMELWRCGNNQQR